MLATMDRARLLCTQKLDHLPDHRQSRFQTAVRDAINFMSATPWATLVNSNTFEYMTQGFLNAPSGFSGSGTYTATSQDVVPCH